MDAVAQVAPGHTLSGFEPLQGGISAEAFRLSVDGPNPRTIVARFPHRDSCPEREFKVLQLVEELGLPAPKPLYLGEDFFLLDWMEGAPLLSPSDPISYATQIADLMLKIHRHSPSDLSPLPWEEDPLSHEPDMALREPEVRARLAELPTPEAVVKLRHGDMWPGNLIWQDEKLVGAIDWEECCLGHPLEDVSIARIDLLWVAGEEAMHAFTEAYDRKTPINSKELAYFDLKAATRPMGYLHHWTAEYPKLGRPDITVESMTKGHNWFVEQALSRSL